MKRDRQLKHFPSTKSLLITAVILPCAVYFLMSLSAWSTEALPLWPNGAPGALGTADKDIPSLNPYPLKTPEATKVAAIIVCPGGGYRSLADHESYNVAEWLNRHGVIIGKALYDGAVDLREISRRLKTTSKI